MVNWHSLCIPVLQMSPRRIGFLGFDGVAALDFTGPLEAFAAAEADDSAETRRKRYEVRIISLGAKNFCSESGVNFKAQHTLENAPPLDTLVIPGGAGVRNPETLNAIAGWLQRTAPEVRRIAAVCGGIFPLAASGLLEGRRVTTHWRYTRDLARQFPSLRVNTTAAFLKDGTFFSCGGGTAAIEMTLAMIDEDYGTRLALSVARELVMRLRPAGDDESQLDPSQYQSGPTERLAELPAWISAHMRDDLSVEVLADRAGVCPRHFSRLFKHVFSCTPADFVEQVRLSEARRRLLIPRNSIEAVAAAIGFKSTDAFRRAFERRLGVTPSAFRKRFQFKAGTPVPGRFGDRPVVVPHRKLRAA
jgi:transcriptional regulator GlxA family with amidase domain